MTNTNNMNSFVRFSEEIIDITSKSFSLIYAYSQEFNGSDKQKFSKLNEEFDKLISKFGKSEVDNFPILKERAERGLTISLKPTMISGSFL